MGSWYPKERWRNLDGIVAYRVTILYAFLEICSSAVVDMLRFYGWSVLCINSETLKDILRISLMIMTVWAYREDFHLFRYDCFIWSGFNQ
jgi:hypothetical protein